MCLKVFKQREKNKGTLLELNLQCIMFLSHATATQRERKIACTEKQACVSFNVSLAEAEGLITDTVSKVGGSPDPLGVGASVWGSRGVLNALGYWYNRHQPTPGVKPLKPLDKVSRLSHIWFQVPSLNWWVLERYERDTERESMCPLDFSSPHFSPSG